MKRLALALLVAAAPAFTGVTAPVGSAVRASLEAWRTPREIRDLAALPAPVAKRCADMEGRLAAPGQSWEATDDDTYQLPHARLLRFVRSGNEFLVHSETREYAHVYWLLAVRLRGKTARTL